MRLGMISRAYLIDDYAKGKGTGIVDILLRLSRSAGFEPDETKADALIRITAFNIEARYPDVKRSFRKKCTMDFTNEQMEIIKEVFEWVKSQLP